MSFDKAALDRYITREPPEPECEKCGVLIDSHDFADDDPECERPICNPADVIVYEIETMIEDAATAEEPRRIPPLTLAIALAQIAHRGQKDKSGHPFVGHPLRVMARVAPDEKAMTVAVLHDVVEDTPVTKQILATMFTAEIVEAVDAISQRKEAGETYRDYLDRVVANELAAKVKLADLRDNMDPDRQWTDGPGMTKSRYLPAWKRLTGREYEPERDGR